MASSGAAGHERCTSPNAQIAAERGAQVSGLDASEELLSIAKTRVPRGTFRTGDLQDLPFADASFDVVTGFNSFQYAADPIAALVEARRVARKGGQVVILTWGDPQGMEAAALVAALKPLLLELAAFRRASTPRHVAAQGRRLLRVADSAARSFHRAQQ